MAPRTDWLVLLKLIVVVGILGWGLESLWLDAYSYTFHINSSFSFTMSFC